MFQADLTHSPALGLESAFSPMNVVRFGVKRELDSKSSVPGVVLLTV